MFNSFVNNIELGLLFIVTPYTFIYLIDSVISFYAFSKNYF